MNISPELRLLWAPSAEYRRILTTEPNVSPSSSWIEAFGRVLFVAFVIGTVTAVAATGRVSWSLVASGTLCWTFVAVVQMVTGVALVRSAGSRVNLSRALSLFFLGHGAWSLWLIGAAAVLSATPAAAYYLGAILTAALVPAIWTARLVFAFSREVLGFATRQAVIRTILHQTATYAVFIVYCAWAVQLWPRILAALGS